MPGLAAAIQVVTGTAQAVAARTLQRLWVGCPELQAGILQATAGNRLWRQLLVRLSSLHAADTAAQMQHSMAADQQQPLDTSVPAQQPPHSTIAAPLQPPGRPGGIGTHSSSLHLEQWTCALPTPQEAARALCQTIVQCALQQWNQISTCLQPEDGTWQRCSRLCSKVVQVWNELCMPRQLSTAL